MNDSFSALEVQRYSRQMLLREVGSEGQLKLKQARVLVVGLGGLGSPCSLYLAAGGVGQLGIVDFDRIDRSNLHRQTLFEDSDIGKSKALMGQKKLQTVNPHLKIVAYDLKLTRLNALSLFESYDLIVDATDNFSARYLINDACVLLKKPFIQGSISQFEGQISFFGLPDGPCYRCLYPNPPPPNLMPNCAQAGVLGVLPGVIGMIQATETLKWILGIGECLKNRLLLFDALALSFKELALEKNLHCPVCSERSQLRHLEDGPDLCRESPPSFREIEASEFKMRIASGEPLVVLDVRSLDEYRISNRGGISLPLDLLIREKEKSSVLNTLEKSQTLFVHCASGHRSAKAAKILQNLGFKEVWNVRGNFLDPI